MNPLYQQMNNNSGISQLLTNFKQFKNSFSGNPQQKVQELLNSGRISQAQYNQAVQMANQLQQLLK